MTITLNLIFVTSQVIGEYLLTIFRKRNPEFSQLIFRCIKEKIAYTSKLHYI
jgi:hypothetical protein